MNILSWLCLGNILYVGWVAMRQRDLNLLIGNSSVAHMGFIFLGIASLNLIGVTGAVFIMVAHGFLAALTFALSGYIYQQDRHAPNELSWAACAVRCASSARPWSWRRWPAAALPGFANFVGEVTVFFGAWKVFPTVTVLRRLGRPGHRRHLHDPRRPERFARAGARQIFRVWPTPASGANSPTRCCWPPCLFLAVFRNC